MIRLIIMFYFPYFPPKSILQDIYWFICSQFKTIISSSCNNNTAAIYRSDIFHLTFWTEWKKGIDTSSAQNLRVFKVMSDILTKRWQSRWKYCYVKELKRKSGRTIWMETSYCLGVLLGPPPCSAGLFLIYIPPVPDLHSPCSRALPLPDFLNLIPVGDHNLVYWCAGWF